MQLNVTPYANVRLALNVCIYIEINLLLNWPRTSVYRTPSDASLCFEKIMSILVSCMRVHCILMANFRGKSKLAGPNIGV